MELKEFTVFRITGNGFTKKVANFEAEQKANSFVKANRLIHPMEDLEIKTTVRQVTE